MLRCDARVTCRGALRSVVVSGYSVLRCRTLQNTLFDALCASVGLYNYWQFGNDEGFNSMSFKNDKKFLGTSHINS